jgi:hypothetical protein
MGALADVLGFSAWDVLAQMDRQEVKAIVGFLATVEQGVEADDDKVVNRATLAELADIVDRLMNAAFDAAPLKKRVRLARLERKARQHKRQIEAKLDARD